MQLNLIIRHLCGLNIFVLLFYGIALDPCSHRHHHQSPELVTKQCYHKKLSIPIRINSSLRLQKTIGNAKYQSLSPHVLFLILSQNKLINHRVSQVFSRELLHSIWMVLSKHCYATTTTPSPSGPNAMVDFGELRFWFGQLNLSASTFWFGSSSYLIPQL